MKKPPKKEIGHQGVAKSKSKNQSKSIFKFFGRKQIAAQVSAPGTRAAVTAMQCKCDQEDRQNAPLEVTPSDRRARLQKILRDMRGNDADTQARRVLLALEGGPCTSLELRKFVDCIQVSTRVHELRQRGFEIETLWVKQATDAAKLHRVALYVLRLRAQ
jgi:hypothetical protein